MECGKATLGSNRPRYSRGKALARKEKEGRREGIELKKDGGKSRAHAQVGERLAHSPIPEVKSVREAQS